MAPILSSWPWERWGSLKYALYAPFALRLACSRPWEGGALAPADALCFHVLLLCLLRAQVHTLWCSYGNMLFLTRNRRIVKEGVDFRQIDREWDWDNFLIMQALIGAAALCLFPSTARMPLWNPAGFAVALLVHTVVSEPLFYLLHRALHNWRLYAHYHSLHHSSPVPQSLTAGHATPLEHLVLSLVMGLPLAGAAAAGRGSVALFYCHVLAFDFLRCMAHSNVEVIPHSLFLALPPLKYLVCTPTYHALHHAKGNCNFGLFMPLFDAIGRTLDEESWTLHRKIRSARNEVVPDFVFLAHVVDPTQAMHAPFVFRSWSSRPYTMRVLMLLLLPVSVTTLLLMWVFSKTFLISFYYLRGKLHQTWAVPRFGFQYFVSSAKDGINKQIDMAILRADKLGVKVVSLAALNKNESLNRGGALFVQKHPDLRVRVVHGNTLTAAVIIKELPDDVEEVFLTGATSKLGRAIALYLCRKKVRVLMFTLAEDRFLRIQREAPPEFQKYLIQVTKFQAAQHCKRWIVGKWLSPMEQMWAPKGTHFHQFAVPPLFGVRWDCTYGKLAAMRLPPDVEGLGSCEYTLDRGVVHACHAGGVVHFLEGWTHHEVGPLDVDRIDVVWEAAMRHGLRPA